MNLHSLERRRERYFLIYIWKILEGHVPNISVAPSAGVISKQHPRLGRMCVVPKVRHQAPQSIQTIKDASLAVKGSQLFNCLPVRIRNITGKSVDYFKRYLDNHLKSIPDQPSIPHYVARRCALIDQSWYRNDNQDNHQGGVSIDSNSGLPRQL